MRELVLNKLKDFIADTEGYGIPRYFDCPEEDNITDPAELDSMSDQELLDVFENAFDFQG